MQRRSPVPLQFKFELFGEHFISTVSVRGEDYICVKAYPNQQSFTNHCKDFLDYYFGWCQLPLEWQRVNSVSPSDYLKIKQQIVGSILNVKRKQAFASSQYL